MRGWVNTYDFMDFPYESVLYYLFDVNRRVPWSWLILMLVHLTTWNDVQYLLQATFLKKYARIARTAMLFSVCDSISCPKSPWFSHDFPMIFPWFSHLFGSGVYHYGFSGHWQDHLVKPHPAEPARRWARWAKIICLWMAFLPGWIVGNG